jgi:tetratricopeptide (TPR) repeat protein
VFFIQCSYHITQEISAEEDVVKEGLELMKSGNFDSAVSHFQAVLRSIATLRTRGVFKEAERFVLLERLERRSQLNLSLALLKLRRWPEVLDVCDEILKADTSNSKAMLRKTQALRMIGRLDEADECARKLGDDGEARTLRAEIAKDKKSRAMVDVGLWRGKLGGRVKVDVSKDGLLKKVINQLRSFCCRKRLIS